MLRRIAFFLFLTFESLLANGQIRSSNALIPTSSNSANTLSVQLRSLNELGSFYTSKDPDSAFYYAKLALDKASDMGDESNYALAKKTMGEIFYLQGAYDNAISHLTDALHIFQSLNNAALSAQTKLSLGAAYQFHDLWDKALVEFHGARNIFKKLDDSLGLAESYGVIGHYYEKTAMADSGFYYQFKALDIYESLEDSRGLAVIYDNIGSIYEDLEDFDEAYSYFMLSAKYDSICNNLPALVNTLNNLGDTYRKKGLVDSSVYFTQIALNLADSLKLNYEVLSAYHDLAKVYRSNKQEQLALKYYDSAYEFSQSLFNSQIAGQIANFQTLYDTQEKERAITELEANQRFDRKARTMMVLGSSGLLFFLILVILQERKRRSQATMAFKAQEELSNQRIRNIELEQKTLQTELENKKLREEQFYREIEDRSQDLTNKTLHIIQKNRLLTELRDQIELLHKESKIKSHAVKKLSNSIDKGFEFDKEWEYFQETFDLVHDDFAKRIRLEYPRLTDSEIKLSSLIRMGLSSKDIAGILGITIESLRVSKSRLKKKLKPQENKELKPFLVNY